MKRLRIIPVTILFVVIFSSLTLDCGADDPGPFICSLDDFMHGIHYVANEYRGSGNCWYQNTPHLKFPVRVESHFMKHVDNPVLNATIWAGQQYNSQANFQYRLYADCSIDGVLYDVSCPSHPASDSDAPSYFRDLENFLRTFFPANFRASWRQEYEASRLLNQNYPPLILAPKNNSVQNNSTVEIEARLLFPPIDPKEGWNWTVVFDRWDPSQGSNGKWVSGPHSYTEFESFDEISGNNFYTRGRKQFSFNPGTYRVTARAKAKDGRTTPWSYHVSFTVGQKFVMPDTISPMIAIQSPQENEGFVTGDKVHIRWNSLGVKEKVNIGLIKGDTYREIAPAVGIENTGYWRWAKIPADVKPGEYIISVKTMNGSIKAFRPIRIKMKIGEQAKNLLKPQIKKGSLEALKQKGALVSDKSQLNIKSAGRNYVALKLFEVLSPKEKKEYRLSVNLKVVTPKKNRIHFRLGKRIGDTDKWDTDWKKWVASEDELVDKGTHFLWEKNLTLEPTDYYFIARPNDSTIPLGPAASDSNGIQFEVKKLSAEIGRYVVKKDKVADISSVENLKKKIALSGDQNPFKPVLLLPAVKMQSLSNGSPVALKFRHDVQQKKFTYSFEKWNTKKNNWVKTREPRMVRSQTSQGKAMVMTTAYFRFKTPGKYRWGMADIPSQKWQEIVVGEAVAKRVAVKTSTKQAANQGKEPGQVPPPIVRTQQEKNQTKSVHKKREDTKIKAFPKIGKPVFQNISSDQKFTAGESIFIKIKSNPKYKNLKIKYELYKNACKGKPFKVSNNNNFAKLPAGSYCIRAVYLGGKKANWSKGIPFVVEEKKKVKIAPKQQPKNIKKQVRPKILKKVN